MKSAKEMSRMTVVPQMKNADTDRSVVPEVTMVRESICEVLMLITSWRLLSLSAPCSRGSGRRRRSCR